MITRAKGELQVVRFAGESFSPLATPEATDSLASGSLPSIVHAVSIISTWRLGDKPSRTVSIPEGPGTTVLTRTHTRTQRPSMYRVLLLNDDYTPMDFVVHVLERFFNKNKEDAARIMLHVHQVGVGECGVFTFEVAETKVTQVMDFSCKHQHPLQCVMEKK